MSKKKVPDFCFGENVDFATKTTTPSRITAKTNELIALCVENGYQCIVGAAPDNAYELFQKGETVKNVVAMGCSPFHFGYIVSRLIKGFAEVHGKSSAELTGLFAEICANLVKDANNEEG